MKLERLKNQQEKYIELLFDIHCEIEELEQKKPGRHLSNKHKTMLGFLHQGMLMRNLWDELNKHNLSIEKRVQFVQEIGEMTHEHYKNLYYLDTKEIAKS